MHQLPFRWLFDFAAAFPAVCPLLAGVGTSIFLFCSLGTSEATEQLGGDTTPIAVVRRLLTGLIHQTIREEDESRYFTPALNSLLDRYWGHGDPLGHGSAFDADVPQVDMPACS